MHMAKSIVMIFIARTEVHVAMDRPVSVETL